MGNEETSVIENLRQELKEAQACFTEALKSARHVLYRLNIQKGGYDYMSPYFEELTGYPLPEFMKVTIDRLPDYIHPEDRERIFGENGQLAEAFRNRTGKEVHGCYEYRFRKADGSYCRLSDRNTAYFDDNGNIICFVGSAHDISESFETRENFIAGEYRFRTLFDTMHEGFALHELICDEQGEPVDYRFLDINPAFEQLTGLRRETTIGRTVRELLPGIEEEWIQTFGRVALTGEPAEREGYSLDLDRHYRARAYSPQRGSFAVVFEDITAHKLAQQDQKQRGEQLRVLVESSYAGIIQVDPTGLIMDANRRMAEMLGCSRDELIGSRYIDYLHPDHRAVGDDRMRRLIRGEIDHVSYERHYIRADGSDFWGYLSGGRHVDATGVTRYLFGHIFDITDRKLAEDALREKERTLQTIIDASPECIKLLAPDGSLVMMNRAGLEMIEADSLEQVKGQFMYNLVVDRYRSAFMELSHRVFDGESGELEFEAVGLHGRPVWLETHAVPFRKANDEIVALLGMTRDVTARKQVELELAAATQKLQDSETIYRTLFEQSPDGIQLTDPVTLKPIYFNTAIHQQLGYSREEYAELQVSDYEQVDSPDRIAARITALRESGSLTFESVYKTKQGTPLHVLVSLRLITISNQPRILAIVRDITERKQAEAERLSLERQVLHAQKLESLGVLAGGIAHDFNNILTAIIGNAELARIRLNPESPAIENLQRIENAAARASDLARQMLAYSGKGHFVVEAIDLNRLVEEMGHMLEVSISKKAVLRYDLTRPLPTVEVDATQIRQVVMNLVINASEAIGDRSGVLAVRTGCMDCSEAYLADAWLIDQLHEGLFVFLEVVDTGCGMDKETQSRIFDPFFTTKFTGRGLGMAAVLGIVRGHNGAVIISSEPGKGSSFKVLLPASGRPAELLADSPGPDAWSGSGTVLLVDDEETVRTIGGEMLGLLGYDVVTAADGREALEVYRRRNDIRLVILDLTMPHLDGEECLRELRQLDPDVKVIMTSGFSESEVARKFAGKGMAGFIQKPYTIGALREMLRKMFG